MRISKAFVAVASLGMVVGLGLQSVQSAQADTDPGIPILQACKATTDSFVSLQAAPEIGIGTNVPVKAGYLRLWDEQVAWRNLFPTSNTPDPTAMKVLSDRLDQAHSSGSKALYVMGLTPQWAAADPTAGDARFGAGSASPPSNPEYFDNYVRTLVTAFGSKIDAYELWNEGNIKTFWSGSAEQLADLTARAYSIIKAGDPSAVVLAPSTTLRLGNAMNVFVSGFINQAAKTSPAYAFDGFAIHSYPSGTGTPADRATLIKNWQTSLAIALPDSANAVLERPIWDTEVNYGLAGPGATPATDYTDAQGAELLKQTYADSKALGVDATFWYLYTAAPFDLLGVQFWSGTPATIAAWSETRSKWATGTGACSAPPAAGSSGSTSGTTGSTLVAQHSGPVVSVGFVTLPESLSPPVGTSTTIVGNQPGTCTQSASDSALTVACGSVVISPCTVGPNSVASNVQQLTSRDLPPGLYVQVLDGLIHITNDGGAQNFTAGQFGFTPNLQQPPVVIPNNPGIQFTPPPSFTPNTPIPGASQAPTCSTTARVGDLRAKAAPTFTQGDVAMIQAGGFEPGTTVSAYLGKNSGSAASLNTDAQGHIAMWIRVPASTPLGATTIQLNGHLASKALVSITSGVSVRAAVPHVVAGTVVMDAQQKKLNAKERSALNRIAVQVPATVPAQCAVTSTPGNAKSIKKYFAKYGLQCTVKPSANATQAKVKVNFAN